jgi:hypothetical protein
MPSPENLQVSLEGLEIGATSAEQLHVVFKANRIAITLKLTADEGDWLASALNHWAHRSRLINSN